MPTRQAKVRGKPDSEPTVVARLERLRDDAWNCSDAGRYRQAVVILRRAIGIAEQNECCLLSVRLALWNQLGINHKYCGNYAAAGRCYRLALRDSGKLALPARNSLRADLYHNLGGLEHSRRRFARGEPYARKSVHCRKQVEGSGSVALAADKVALAAILDGLSKFRESRKLYASALKTYRRVYGKSHREIALILNNLGAICHATEHYRQAESLYKEAVRMKERELGPNHPDLAITLNNLAKLCQVTGRRKDAQRHFEDAVRILARTLGHFHPTTKAVRKSQRRLAARSSG